MNSPDGTRRSFLRSSAAFAGTTSLLSGLLRAQTKEADRPLFAYVGTFSSPLRDVLPTQVDLPPGNGRGIHLFRVDRADRGDDARRRPRDGHQPEPPGRERGRHPPVLRQRDRPRGRGQGGHGQRLRHRPGRRDAEAAQHRPLRRGRPDLREPPPVRQVPARGQLLRRLGRGAAGPRRREAWATPPTSRPTTARSARRRRPTPRRGASPSAATTGRTPT